ncbi:MAG: hypothetical protein [Caudoviricetes sp.]|nr:MAG: hypothetical protein [Caudoviricetes sp.]
MLKISTIPSNTTCGKYNVFIGGFHDYSPEGGQIESSFNVIPSSNEEQLKLSNVDDDFNCSSFEEGITILINNVKDSFYDPSYHDLYIVIEFNGNNILDEYDELKQETIKYKDRLSKKEYTEWCEFVFDEICKKDFLYETVRNISKKILS